MVDTRVWLTPDVVDIVDTREGAPGTFVFCRMIGGRGGGGGVIWRYITTSTIQVFAMSISSNIFCTLCGLAES